jgi:hypothetical protein
MGDLDLDGVALVAVVVLPAALDELPATKTRIPFFRCALRSRRPIAMQYSEEPVVDVLPLPVVLGECWLTATVKPARAAPLWV